MAFGAKLEFISAREPEAIRMDVSSYKIIKPPLAPNTTRLGSEGLSGSNSEDESHDDEFQPFSDATAESAENSSLTDEASSMEDSEKSDTEESSADEAGKDLKYREHGSKFADNALVGAKESSQSHELPESQPYAPQANGAHAQSGLFFDVNENPHDKGTRPPQRIHKSWHPSARSPVGLENRGVTCYQNAAVQTLLHLPALGRYLLDVLKGAHPKVGKSSVTVELANLFKKLMERKVPLFPARLLRRLEDINPMLDEWQQEDSHEYYMSLISRLQEDSVPRGEKLRSSILHDIFGGSVEQKVTCERCETVSTTTQDFYDLPVSFSQSESKNHYSLERSVHDFFTPELIAPYREIVSHSPCSSDTNELSADSPSERSSKAPSQEVGGYHCDICKDKTRAIKRIMIAEAPEYLTVHIKRFKMDGHISKKLKDTMSFPLELDLTRYEKETDVPLHYKLVSVILHEGRTVSSGHYIALTRQPNNEWVMYDDETVRNIPETQVTSHPSAYILVYSRLLARPQHKISKSIAREKPELENSQSLPTHRSERVTKSHAKSSHSKVKSKTKSKSSSKILVPPLSPQKSPQKSFPVANGAKSMSDNKAGKLDKRNSIDDIFNSSKRRKG